MHKILILSCLGVMLACAQENTSGQTGSSEAYPPAEVKILGDLDYGHSKTMTGYSTGPRYRAFVFSGYGGDQVQISVRGALRATPIVLADSSLNPIATGSSSLSVSLPNHGPDIEVWYIITGSTPGPVTVQLKKVGHQDAPVHAEPISTR